MTVKRSDRSRCLAVGAGLTAAAWVAASALARAVAEEAGPRETTDESLVWVCLVALLVAVVWGWLQGFAAVVDAWRGSTGSTRPGTVRRLVLTACGVAVVTVLATQSADAAASHPGPDILTGLPLPERAEGPAHATRRSAVVRSGDTLWALAAAELSPPASASDITDRWHLIYRRNHAVIGADPDLIRPGQLLELPHLTTREQS
jgi:hypothetical protein